MLFAAVFASSWLFEMERLLMSSSRTVTDCDVSFAEVAGTVSITSTAGMLNVKVSSRLIVEVPLK